MFREQRVLASLGQYRAVDQSAQAGLTHVSELGRESRSNSQPASAFFLQQSKNVLPEACHRVKFSQNQTILSGKTANPSVLTDNYKKVKK